MQDLFVDRLGNVIISNGVARLDFMRIRPGEGDKKELKLEPSIRLAIPVEGLAQMVGMLEQMRQQLAQQGAAAREQAAAAGAETAQK